MKYNFTRHLILIYLVNLIILLLIPSLHAMMGRTPNSGPSATMFVLAFLLTGSLLFLGDGVITMLRDSIPRGAWHALVVMVYIVPLLVADLITVVLIPDLYIGSLPMRFVSVCVIGLLEFGLLHKLERISESVEVSGPQFASEDSEMQAPEIH